MFARARICTLLSILLLALDMFLGFRSGGAFAAFAAALIIGYRTTQIPAVKRVAFVLMAAVFYFVMSAYKLVLPAIRLQDWALFVTIISDPDFWWQPIMYSEPFVTQFILNDVISRDIVFSIDALEVFMAQLILYGNDQGLLPYTFGEFYNTVGVVGLEWGLAANIWAEMWAVGGTLAIVAFATLHCAIIVILAKLLDYCYYTGRSWFAALASIGAIVVFYIHRNDVHYTLLMVRRVLLMFLVISVGAWILETMKRQAKARLEGLRVSQ
jgi:hypothetical protein